MTHNNLLPKELSIRPPTMDDLEPVVELLAACGIAELGEADYTIEDLQTEWQTPGLNLNTDAWLVTTPERNPVGYAFVWNKDKVQLRAQAYVHPQHYNRGIGTYLVRLTEKRARQQVVDALPETRVVLRNAICHSNKDAQRLLAAEDYTPVRHFWRMRIEMNQAPPPPKWPKGIGIRTFVPGQDERTTFEAMEDAFRDHWGYTPWHYDTWENRTIKREDFDPTVWFLATDNGEIAGGALCQIYPDEGWVGQLGVRRQWRRRGLGLALLRHSFCEFYGRGIRRVSLGVDVQNPTGATKLYKRAGMRVAHQFDLYEKELRPGKELESAASKSLEN